MCQSVSQQRHNIVVAQDEEVLITFNNTTIITWNSLGALTASQSNVTIIIIIGFINGAVTLLAVHSEGRDYFKYTVV